MQLLDVACLASIRKFALSWQAQKRPLHILVNNAGIFTMGGRILLYRSLASHLCYQRSANVCFNMQYMSYLSTRETVLDPHGVQSGVAARCVTKDGFEGHMGTNYLGPFLLTMLLLPCLQRTAEMVRALWCFAPQ